MPSDEKNTRDFPRLKQAIPLELRGGDEAQIIDLSAAGMRIQAMKALKIGATIQGKLTLAKGGKAIPLKGTVMWVTPKPFRGHAPVEMGIQLAVIPDEYLDALAELFAAMK